MFGLGTIVWMKALMILSSQSGRHMSQKKIEKVKKELSESFEQLDVYRISDMAEAEEYARSKVSEYDVYLISGGDGTFHHIVNAIAPMDNLPILGYIQSGTICDVGRFLGVKRKSRALRIIKEGYCDEFDLMKVNDAYALYMTAVGAFSDISYKASRRAIRAFGRLAYYFRAVFEAFRPRKTKASVRIGENEFEHTSPFFMILNGPYVGGFKVNGRSSQNDGLAEYFDTTPSLFNGLVHYFFHYKINRVPSSSFVIQTEKPMPWSLDGEMRFVSDKAEIEILHRKLRVFTQKPHKNS